MHTIEETDMLATKLDLLIKRLDKHGTVQSLYSHIPCEVCGNFKHSGNDCLETREDVLNDNNVFRPQRDPGWNQSHPQYQEGNFAYNSNFANQPSLINVVLRQTQINENLTKKHASNDKILENINSKIEGLTSSLNNQLSLNKIFKNQTSSNCCYNSCIWFWKDLGATQNYTWKCQCRDHEGWYVHSWSTKMS